jgi:hypothetical protein
MAGRPSFEIPSSNASGRRLEEQLMKKRTEQDMKGVFRHADYNTVFPMHELATVTKSSHA